MQHGFLISITEYMYILINWSIHKCSAENMYYMLWMSRIYGKES